MSKLAIAIANAICDFNSGVLESYDQLYEQLNRDIDFTKVKVWREDKSIPLPKYGKEGDACCDVYAKSIEYDDEKDRYVIHTGLHFALPEDYEMEIRPRSSNTKTDLYMPNGPGTLDWGYRGELLIIFKNRTNVYLDNAIKEAFKGISLLAKEVDRLEIETKVKAICINNMDNLAKTVVEFPYKVGDRICQILVRRREQIEWDEVETLEALGSTERGTGGFGSTGGAKINKEDAKR